MGTPWPHRINNTSSSQRWDQWCPINRRIRNDAVDVVCTVTFNGINDHSSIVLFLSQCKALDSDVVFSWKSKEKNLSPHSLGLLFFFHFPLLTVGTKDENRKRKFVQCQISSVTISLARIPMRIIIPSIETRALGERWRQSWTSICSTREIESPRLPSRDWERDRVYFGLDVRGLTSTERKEKIWIDK